MVEASAEKAAPSHNHSRELSLSIGDSDQVLDRLAAELARDRGGATGRYAQATLYQWHGWRKLKAARAIPAL